MRHMDRVPRRIDPFADPLSHRRAPPCRRRHTGGAQISVFNEKTPWRRGCRREFGGRRIRNTVLHARGYDLSPPPLHTFEVYGGGGLLEVGGDGWRWSLMKDGEGRQKRTRAWVVQTPTQSPEDEKVLGWHSKEA